MRHRILVVAQDVTLRSMMRVSRSKLDSIRQFREREVPGPVLCRWPGVHGRYRTGHAHSPPASPGRRGRAWRLRELREILPRPSSSL